MGSGGVGSGRVKKFTSVAGSGRVHMAQMVKHQVKVTSLHRTAFTVQFPTHAYEVQRSEDIAIRCTPGDKMVRFYCVLHLL